VSRVDPSVQLSATQVSVLVTVLSGSEAVAEM
jgi:hypothetical protein